MKACIVMLRLLFDPFDYGYPNRCIPHWYETTWLWEKLRPFALLLRRIALSFGRTRRTWRPLKIKPFEKFIFPAVQRPYPVIRAEDIVGVQPMTRASGLDALIKKQFGKGRA